MVQTRKKPNPIDGHVGSRIRLRRSLLGLSQTKLGDAMGVTFQQVQKYERGANRISASKLYTLSCVLNVPISFFFEGVSQLTSARSAPGCAEPAAKPYKAEPMIQRETLKLVHAYYGIGDPEVRKDFLHLMRSLRKG
jgi:transcriptional regulator with XRE-family HTH domain